jgi:fucose permease
MCYSFNFSVIGQMFEPLKKEFGFSIALTSLLPTIQSLGGFMVCIVGIFFLGSFNIKKVFVVQAFFSFLIFSLVGTKPPIAILIILFFLLGSTGTFIDFLSNPILLDVVDNKAENHLNFMHSMFTFGAMIAPFVAQLIFNYSGLSGTFYIMGGFGLLCALFAMYAFKSDIKRKLIEKKESVTSRIKDIGQVLKKHGIKVVVTISLLYFWWEMSSCLFISAAITSIHKNSGEGALSLMVYFFGLMISRFIYSKFAARFSQGKIISYGALLSLFFGLSALVIEDIVVKIVFIGISAFFNANTIPLSVIAACKIAPQNTLLSAGIVMTTAYAAIFIFTPITGLIGDLFNLNYALYFLSIPLFLTIPLGYITHKKMKKIG